MLKIRLKRTGRKGQPHYRVVVAEASNNRDGHSVAEVGYYNPRTSPSTVDFDKEAIKDWLSKGAQPTETVQRLLAKEGVMEAPKKGSTLAEPRKPKKERDQ